MSGRLILDITSDQFGEPDVFVGCADSRLYRPGVDTRSTLQTSPGALAAVDGVWASWLSSDARGVAGRGETAQ